jgi:deoxyribodipyrimidine photo-lyase
MYLAALVCNFGKAHWYNPSKWMYYHLLDGDPASNALSWQWVAGSFSSKKYYCNQDNINKYTGSNQKNSFLDKTYEELVDMEIPKSLMEREDPDLHTIFPKSECDIMQKVEGDVFIYNSFNLDPVWHINESGERIFLLEPSHFEKHPISEMVMQFIIDQSKFIPNIKICVCEFSELKKEWTNAKFIFKKHPTTKDYNGTEEIPLSLFPEVNGYFPSFSSYWKKAERAFFTMAK